MNILLFGSLGQLGSELRKSLAPLGRLHAPDRTSTDYCGDLTNPDGIARTIAAVKPDVIVNAAAYTAVDKAEDDLAQSMLVNAIAPEVMAVEAKRLGARMVHYSTDYVFDGSGQHPYRETDEANPINAYGRSKKAGEDAIIAAGCRYLIFRTSWVYGMVGKNFVKTIIELAKARQTLNVVYDQIGAPTDAAFLAESTAHILQKHPDQYGLYHCAASGETSWFDYARFIVETARSLGVPLALLPQAISPISSREYPTPARRPLNSRLNTAHFQETFGILPPQWQNGVTHMLSQLYKRTS